MMKFEQEEDKEELYDFIHRLLRRISTAVAEEIIKIIEEEKEE